MGKKTIHISIDENLHHILKEKTDNLSLIINEFLMEYVGSDQKPTVNESQLKQRMFELQAELAKTTVELKHIESDRQKIQEEELFKKVMAMKGIK